MASTAGQIRPGSPQSNTATNPGIPTEILTFFQTHYNYANQPQNTNATSVYNFYKKVNSASPYDYQAFRRQSGRVPELKSKKLRGPQGRKQSFLAMPKSAEAKAFHATQTKEFDLFTANIQGLTSAKKGNKCVILKGIANSTENEHQIIALTETWLSKGQHYDAEILDILPNFRLFRSDRDTKPRSGRQGAQQQQNTTQSNTNTSDQAQLSSRGGCAILTSPDIIAECKTSFSNGNCELLIVECTELAISLILVYRPAGINFSLQKFK